MGGVRVRCGRMPPSKKPQKPVKSIDFCLLPLASSTFGNQSEIDAQIEAAGKWKTIATVYSVARSRCRRRSSPDHQRHDVPPASEARFA